MSNNNHIIDQIISQADIVKIIGKHVELKRSGGEFKGCCPFHGEKSPSFFVNPQKGVYNCFGCGVAGNALTFLKEYEHMTAGEALRELSRQTGIELPKEPVNKDHIYKIKPKVTPKSPNNPASHPTKEHRAATQANPKANAVSQNSANMPTTNTPTAAPTIPLLAENNSPITTDFFAGNSEANKHLPTEHLPTNSFLQAAGGLNADNFLRAQGVLQVQGALQSDSALPIEGSWQDNSSSANFYVNADYADNRDDNSGYFDNHSPDFSSQFSPAFAPEFDVVAETVEESSGNLYDLLTKISAFYRQQLYNNQAALQYFSQRGVSDSTLAEFELGYAPAGWQHLETAFPQDIEGLKILGLVRTSEKGKTFNLLRERVIFPIRDSRGRTVGFAGRAMSDEVKPKYINSSDSPVFHKQMQLFGLYEGRQARAKNWLVVEGYMDVISLHQAGVYGAVAAMGTAIATPQIEKLLQLNPTLTLCFDGDEAGQKAAWRAMEAGLPALRDSKELRFLTLPQQHDPDSFVKAYGFSAMQQQIQQALPLSQYLFSILSRRHDISIAEGRVKLLAEVSQLTQKLPKGSYGWLLREDMRAKMGLGKRQQARAAQDALLNFDSEMTPQLQLQLCFLYQPEILGGYGDMPLHPSQQPHPLHHPQQMNQQLIAHIFALSKADQIKLPVRKKLTLANIQPANSLPPEIPPNPAYRFEANDTPSPQFAMPLNWENLADNQLFTLIDWIQQIARPLAAFTQQLEREDTQYSEFELINAKAHFILSGLPAAYQSNLMPKWTVFFHELQQRHVTDVSDLVTEIMIKLVIDGLQKKMRATHDFLHKQWLKQQIQVIHNWQQDWFEQKEAS